MRGHFLRTINGNKRSLLHNNGPVGTYNINCVRWPLIGVARKSCANGAVKSVWRAKRDTPRVRLNLIKRAPSRSLPASAAAHLLRVHSSALTPAATRRIFSTWPAPGPEYRICGRTETRQSNKPSPTDAADLRPEIASPTHSFPHFFSLLLCAPIFTSLPHLRPRTIRHALSFSAPHWHLLRFANATDFAVISSFRQHTQNLNSFYSCFCSPKLLALMQFQKAILYVIYLVLKETNSL